jgi:hypothetical protein
VEVAVADLRQPKSRNFLKGNEGKKENCGKRLETHTRQSVTGLLIRQLDCEKWYKPGKCTYSVTMYV